MASKPRLLSDQDDIGIRHATWLELFYDLVYVVAISRVAAIFTHDFSLAGFLKFAFLFLPIWWAWTGHTMLSNRFDTNDKFHRGLTFLQMLGALFLAVYVEEAFGQSANAFALSFFCVRLILIIAYIRIFIHIMEIRYSINIVIVGFCIGTAIWLVSLGVESPYKYVLWAVGLTVDFVSPLLANRRLEEIPVHSEHLPERLGLFTIIVLGESIFAVITSIADIHWTVEIGLTAILGFVLAVSLWWLYFEYSENFISGKRLGAGQLYIYGHLPIYLGLVTFAVGMEHLISAHANGSQTVARAAVCGGLLLSFAPLTFFQLVKLPNNLILKWLYPEFLLMTGLVIMFLTGNMLSDLVFIMFITVIFLVFINRRHNSCSIYQEPTTW